MYIHKGTVYLIGDTLDPKNAKKSKVCDFKTKILKDPENGLKQYNELLQLKNRHMKSFSTDLVASFGSRILIWSKYDKKLFSQKFEFSDTGSIEITEIRCLIEDLYNLSYYPP